MVEFFINLYENIVAFDLIYIINTLLSLIKCSRQGFVLSILAAAKWLLAYVITLILFPRIKPYVDDVIDNEYILDIILGVGIFIIVIFLILMINKGISRALKLSGLGKFTVGKPLAKLDDKFFLNLSYSVLGIGLLGFIFFLSL